MLALAAFSNYNHGKAECDSYNYMIFWYKTKLSCYIIPLIILSTHLSQSVFEDASLIANTIP